MDHRLYTMSYSYGIWGSCYRFSIIVYLQPSPRNDNSSYSTQWRHFRWPSDL